MNLFKRGVLGASLSLLAAAGLSAPAQAATAPTSLIPTANTVSFTQGITYQGITRSVLFIHPSATSTTKAPVLVMLHGLGGSPVDLANNTRAGTLAAQMGYWVILPPQANSQWNISAANKSDTVDDVGFLKTLIQTAVQQYPVDASRISMAGMSDGGFMSMRMACEAPNLLASVSAVAAEMVTTETKVCRPVRPLPVLYVMGTADPIVPYGGSTVFSGAANAFSTWAGFNACNTQQNVLNAVPNVVNDGTSVTLQHNAACTSHGETDLYIVQNGGHAWPGAAKLAGSNGLVSQNLNTTATIGAFARLWTNASTI
jgi:polyhydroxybutyrate depolymerase